MAPIYLIIGLVIQGSLIYAETEESELPEGREILHVKPEDDEVIKDFKEAPKDWMDLLMLPDNKLYPTSAAAMMAQATDSGKPIEEQMEDIKEIANKISEAIESELANLLSYAIAATENEKKAGDETKERKRRSAESPIDSTQLVMRLLKHIKSTNEYQNIAIEKMMSAQEIADKFGIEYTPDTEILADLAVAANEHAKELTEMLNEACDLHNKTCQRSNQTKSDYDGYTSDNKTQYIYASHYLDDDYDDMPHPVYKPQSAHAHYYESQIPAPPVNHYSSQISQKPSFYDAVSYTPDYYSHCSVEPTSSMYSHFEEFEPEPELVAEEFEETTSNRFVVERGDEPGSATVNHIMTYSISEKSHFRTPQIERLPQQMQYYFYLI